MTHEVKIKCPLPSPSLPLVNHLAIEQLIDLRNQLISLSFPRFISRIRLTLMSFKDNAQTTNCQNFILKKLLLILLRIIKHQNQRHHKIEK